MCQTKVHPSRLSLLVVKSRYPGNGTSLEEVQDVFCPTVFFGRWWPAKNLSVFAFRKFSLRWVSQSVSPFTYSFSLRKVLASISFCCQEFHSLVLSIWRIIFLVLNIMLGLSPCLLALWEESTTDLCSSCPWYNRPLCYPPKSSPSQTEESSST